jgi:hypothetical protein
VNKAYTDGQLFHTKIASLLDRCEIVQPPRASSPEAQDLPDTTDQLPPPPHIFHGRRTEFEQLLALLKGDPAHAVIGGKAGAGKSSLAIRLIHHPDVIELFEHRRYFLSCTGSTSLSDLVHKISTLLASPSDAPLGGDVEALQPGIHDTLRSAKRRCLFVFDDLGRLSLLYSLGDSHRTYQNRSGNRPIPELQSTNS